MLIGYILVYAFQALKPIVVSCVLHVSLDVRYLYHFFGMLTSESICRTFLVAVYSLIHNTELA